MSILRIQFGEYTADAGNAFVPMEVINENFKSVWKQPAALGLITEVKVEAGNYLVRAHLPSGDIAAAQAEVGSGATIDVLLQPAKYSPRESLSWAYYLKGTSRAMQSSAIAPLDHAKVPPGIAPNISFWLHRADSVWEPFAYDPQKGGQSYAHIETSSYDSSVQADDPNALVVMEIDTNSGWRWNLGQFWIQVSGAGYPSKFVALPPSDHIRILVALDDEVGQDEDLLNVIVDGSNPQAEALLGFLRNRDFSSARAIAEGVIDSAERLLFDKVRDPASAAIGGYYLLSAGRLDRLHDWTNNLANLFPWLPDGAVIHAWHLLRQKKQDVNQARARLIEAANRGVPLYTRGLRLLFDGLNIFNRRADGTDAEVKSALERISPYASAADWSTPTTSFYGQTPGDPEPFRPIH